MRQLSYAIAMDIHPICNLGVVGHAAKLTEGDGDAKASWMRHFIEPGLRAFKALLNQPATGRFCHGDTPTMADSCLIPQLYNAWRWGVPYEHLEKISSIERACEATNAGCSCIKERNPPRHDP